MARERIKPELLDSYKTQTGKTLRELSAERPLLLVFLRNSGCTFCRESVAGINKIRKEIEGQGTELAFLHLSNDNNKA